MRVKSDNLNTFILYITFLIVTISCNNQSQSNRANHIVQDKNSVQYLDKGINGIRLKYTTGVRSILEDSKGNIWFGSYNEGVSLLQNGNLQYFTTKNGLSDNQVRNIYEDKNGIIWFECGRGLSTFDGKEITVYKDRNYNLKNEWKLNGSDLWFKGDKIEGYNKLEKYPGVYQYDGQKLSYRLFPVTPKPGDGFNYYISTPFVKSKNGAVWFGTYGAVIGYNGSKFKILDNEYLGLNSKTGFLHIRSIIEDRKENLWIANNGIGVLKYDGKKIINFTAQQKLKKEYTKGNSLEKVFSIGEDTAGNIWFGTVGSGVWKYNGNSVKNFTKEDGLESKHIWTIYKTKQGELWFGGANPSGVYRFNGKSFERKY
jgi:ligand-binding sensor domain-containing protein